MKKLANGSENIQIFRGEVLKPKRFNRRLSAGNYIK